MIQTQSSPEQWIVQKIEKHVETQNRPIEHTDPSVAIQILHEQLVHREQTIQALTTELAQQRQAASEMVRQAAHFEQQWNVLSIHMADKNAYIDGLLNGRVMRLLNAIHRRWQQIKRGRPHPVSAPPPLLVEQSTVDAWAKISFDISSQAVLEGWVGNIQLSTEPHEVEIRIDNRLDGRIVVEKPATDADDYWRFSYPLPSHCKDGQPHTIRVLLVNSDTAAETTCTLTAPPTALPGAGHYKDTLTILYRGLLNGFLSAATPLHLPTSSAPRVTIMIVLYNRAELTLQCLRTLLGAAVMPSYEVIIVDNASTDSTGALLDLIEGATIIRNPENRHFLIANNQAAAVARGDYLLLLNNDAQMLPGAIAAAVRTLESASDIGAVGGKILLLDGRLQEAGSIVWNDGTCLGYGRGDVPDAPMYMFQRDVDYCSGAFLLTHRHLFVENGGFDEAFKPCYYEETDYCMRLWRMGKRVVYDPNVVLLHFEFASSTSSIQAIQWQRDHQSIFRRIHARQLANHYVHTDKNILFARTASSKRPRVLILDDYVPHPHLGAGFPRAHTLLLTLLEFGYAVTLYPMVNPYEEWTSVYSDIPQNVEVMTGYGASSLAVFLYQRAGYYTNIIVSRPDNMELMQPILASSPQVFDQTQIIYDAEALFTFRTVAQRQLNGEHIPLKEIQRMLQNEMAIARNVTSIVCVSTAESRHFCTAGFTDVHVLGHAVACTPTPAEFMHRSGILTVGAIHADLAPNADAVLWFMTEILPLVQVQLQHAIEFINVGLNYSTQIQHYANDTIRMVGRVNDITPYYNQSRIFVAPTRFAAGIPMKVHHAAAHGIPIVTTSLIAEQVGWHNEVELLVADNAEQFAKHCVRLYTDQSLWEHLRANALKRIQEECSPEVFRTKLRSILLK